MTLTRAQLCCYVVVFGTCLLESCKSKSVHVRVTVAGSHGEGSLVNFMSVRHADVPGAKRLVREWLYEGKYNSKYEQAKIELGNLRQGDPIYLAVHGQEAVGDLPAGDWVVLLVGAKGVKWLGTVVNIDSSSETFYLNFSEFTPPEKL